MRRLLAPLKVGHVSPPSAIKTQALAMQPVCDASPTDGSTACSGQSRRGNAAPTSSGATAPDRLVWDAAFLALVQEHLKLVHGLTHGQGPAEEVGDFMALPWAAIGGTCRARGH
jgi:hypothetical protein